MSPKNAQGYQMSNEKNDPGCLGYIGDEFLSIYVGILRNQYRDPF